MTMTVPSPLATARTAVEPELRSIVDRLHPECARVAGYHMGWLTAQGAAAEGNGGKALRPALSLSWARAVGASPEQALTGAVAVELVHNFSLLHDDVMDRDAERRHRPTAWTIFGDGRAILAGDDLLVHACAAVATCGAPGSQRALQRLLTAARHLIHGQAADLSFESRSQVSIDECIQMCTDKTAALMSAACAIGPDLCEPDGRNSDAAASYGRHLGVAFQAVDDLLGIWGDPAVTGKPAFNDLVNRKKSLPVAAGLSPGSPCAQTLRRIFETPVGREAAERAARLLEDAGCRRWVEALAERELAEAVQALDAAGIDGAVRSDLEDIARFVTRREA